MNHWKQEYPDSGANPPPRKVHQGQVVHPVPVQVYPLQHLHLVQVHLAQDLYPVQHLHPVQDR